MDQNKKIDDLREKFNKKQTLKDDYPDMQEDDAKKAEQLFARMDERDEQKIADAQKANAEAIKDWNDLIINNLDSFKVDGIHYVMRKHPTIIEKYEYENAKDEPLAKLKYIHSMIVEPEIPFDIFIQMKDFVIKYIENRMVVNFFFGMGKGKSLNE
jgi:hypothetical protein